MDQCEKKHGKIKMTAKRVQELETFCGSLRANKVAGSKTLFTKLPLVVQCLFLYYSYEILSKKSKYSDDSYLTAFRMFKLFRSKEMKGSAIYKRYASLKRTEGYYKKALDWNRKSPLAKAKPSGRTTSGRAPRQSKKYDKKFQRYAFPTGEIDPLYLYYTSLYTQVPKSRLAITWLTEHGVFDGSERTALIKQYEKLVAKDQLIR
jgi:hypothetical protein